MMPLVRLSPTGEIAGKVSTSALSEPFTRTNISIDIANGILSVLTELGYHVVAHTNLSTQEQAAVLDILPNEDLEGVIAMPTGTEESAARFAGLRESGLPIVFVDRYFPQAPIDSVTTDNIGAARECVRLLISRGHRRIAYFTAFQKLTSVAEREQGYRAALEEAGIPVDEEIICGPTICRDDRWDFRYALEHCLRQPEPVTAVFGMNDDMVWGAIQAAQKLGITVPDDLEVAGFFDSAIPRGIEVPFARLVQKKLKIGQLAAHLLLQRIRGEGPSEPQRITVPAELIPVQEHSYSETHR